MRTPGPDPTRICLHKVLTSKSFSGSQRLQTFLRFVSQRVLNGGAEPVKEYELGVEVFERGKDFDPRTDSIVRVEANRLRHKLREYYESEGSEDEIRIELPKGTYQPVFLPVRTALPSAGRAFGPYLAASAGLLIFLGLIAGTRAFLGAKSPASSGPEPNGIAVLPFLSLDGAPDEDRLADGFADELTNRLARFGELRVVARRSAFQFKSKPYDVRDIGVRLHAGSILEGSLRRNGDRMDVNAELVSTASGFHLWSDQFEIGRDDLYCIEDDIMMGVLRALKITPRGGLEPILHRLPPPAPEAHRLYLEGRFYWNQRTFEALQHAIALYTGALEIDPSYALAHAGVAECYAVIAANGLDDTRVAAEKGKVAARKAIALDPTLSEAHAALGLMQSVADWDWMGADASFQRAIALNPSNASAYQWRAHNLLWQGRFPEARAAIQKALDLDSLSLVILSNQAEFAYFMRDYKDAVRLYDRTLAVDPGFISATIERGMVLDQLGHAPDAAASFQKALELTAEEASPLVGLAQACAHMGKKEEARRILSDLQRRVSLHVSNVQIAIIDAALGDIDGGIAALEKAYQKHESFLIQIKVHPDLDPLRRDPRFTELEKRMRLL